MIKGLYTQGGLGRSARPQNQVSTKFLLITEKHISNIKYIGYFVQPSLFAFELERILRASRPKLLLQRLTHSSFQAHISKLQIEFEQSVSGNHLFKVIIASI